ncbi:MAG: metallophosphoesterase [Bdellovibrionales bacterium]
MKTKTRTQLSVVIFFATFASLYAYLHFFAVAFFSNQFTWALLPLASVFSLGFVLTFVGYWMSSRHPHSSFYFVAWIGYIWMGTFFISLAGAVVGAFWELLWISSPDLSQALLLGVILLSSYSLYRGLEFPRVRQEQIKGPPGLRGQRWVQITDLHMGLLHHRKAWLEKVVTTVNSLEADYVFLTGDLVEGRPSIVKPHLESLRHVKARTDRLYILGNHEMIHGGAGWENELREMGWIPLHNEHRLYSFGSTRLMIAGVPDRMIRRFDPRFESNPDRALQTSEKVDFRVLLAHEPSSVFDLQKQTADVILSGHTHGGQIFPFGLLVRMVQPVVARWKTVRGVPIYAHIGTGLWGPPMRLGTRNEIVLFELV